MVVKEQYLLTHARPQALETHNLAIQSDLYTTLTDSLVGLAFASPPDSGPSPPSPGPDPAATPQSSAPHSTTLLAEAETYLDVTHGINRKLKDLQGQLDCLLKKQLFASFKGDGAGKTRAAEMYTQLLEEREKEMREEKVRVVHKNDNAINDERRYRG